MRRCLLVAVLICGAVSGCSGDASSDTAANPLCSKCETDQDCTKQGAELMCLP
ncbi:MAG: hypothetical protein HY898_01585 [Deltaproteobacteria bacterium]|nr:hypothetical protein [Deltaproteobacteria bacterium]